MINGIKTIGIIGGGQLGRMMIPYIRKLGLKVAVLDPAADCPCAKICDTHIIANFNDKAGYTLLAKNSDVITYEFEHIDVKLLKNLIEGGNIIYPSVDSLEIIQDKYTQKVALKAAGIDVPDFYKVQNLDELKELYKRLGNSPIMLKSRKGGYDGKGNAVIKFESDIGEAYKVLSRGCSDDLMAEPLLDFDCEVSVIATRSINGECEVYPIAHNIHRDSILDTTSVPCKLSESIKSKVIDCAKAVMECFKGVGTFCAELFVAKQGAVLVNEVAPRVHNSGHYTIEACAVSQFENHIRAIVGLKPGSTKMLYKAAKMKNIIADKSGAASYAGIEQTLAVEDAHVHIYGKPMQSVGRKMGHITILADSDKEIEDKFARIKVTTV